MGSWFGLDPVIDYYELLKLVLRFLVNIAFASIVIQLVYFRRYRDRDFLFTFYLLNVITFALCFLLRKVPAEFGFALAMFAVFGILRFRTEQIRNRDLTYLFVVIGIGVINAVANKTVGLAELLTVNIIISGMTVLIEYGRFGTQHSSTPVIYDNLSLLEPGRTEELLKDISARTGLAADRVEIESVDLLRDAAALRVFLRTK